MTPRQPSRDSLGFVLMGSIDAAEPPDAVVIDELDADAAALERIREARAAAPEAKLVLLTRSRDPQWLEDAAAAGIDAAVSKTLPQAALWSLVRHVVAENVFHSFARAVEPSAAGEGRGPDRAGARDPAARRLRPVERPHRRAALGHRADREVPPLQHDPQARGHEPHAGEPLRPACCACRGPPPTSTLPEHPAPRVASAESMRAIFVLYVVLIVAGIVTFTIIGLTHH